MSLPIWVKEHQRLRAENDVEVSRTYKLPKWEAQLLSHIERKWGKDGILLFEFTVFGAYILMFSALFVAISYRTLNPVGLAFGLMCAAVLFLVSSYLFAWGWKRSSKESEKVKL